MFLILLIFHLSQSLGHNSHTLKRQHFAAHCQRQFHKFHNNILGRKDREIQPNKGTYYLILYYFDLLLEISFDLVKVINSKND